MTDRAIHTWMAIAATAMCVAIAAIAMWVFAVTIVSDALDRKLADVEQRVEQLEQK